MPDKLLAEVAPLEAIARLVNTCQTLTRATQAGFIAEAGKAEIDSSFSWLVRMPTNEHSCKLMTVNYPTYGCDGPT